MSPDVDRTGVRVLLAASAVSSIGDGVLLTAAPLLTSELTSDPSAVAGVYLPGLLPWLLFALVAGVVVDRVRRRRLMRVVDVLRAVLLGITAAVTGADSVWRGLPARCRPYLVRQRVPGVVAAVGSGRPARTGEWTSARAAIRRSGVRRAGTRRSSLCLASRCPLRGGCGIVRGLGRTAVAGPPLGPTGDRGKRFRLRNGWDRRRHHGRVAGHRWATPSASHDPAGRPDECRQRDGQRSHGPVRHGDTRSLRPGLRPAADG